MIFPISGPFMGQAMQQSREQWVPIPSFEGLYEISNFGNVRRLAYETKKDARGVTKKLREKNVLIATNEGYRVARLWRKGIGTKLYIDRALESVFGIRSKVDDVLSLPGEVWSPILDYPGYEASTLGRIRSRTRVIKRGSGECYLQGRILNTTIPNHGYMKTELTKDGVTRTLTLHRLIAITFIPNPLNLEVVHHKNENKLDNRVENLEWVSNEGNIRDWFDRRRIVISVETIKTIIAAHLAGKTPAEILAGLPRQTKRKRNS